FLASACGARRAGMHEASRARPEWTVRERRTENRLVQVCVREEKIAAAPGRVPHGSRALRPGCCPELRGSARDEAGDDPVEPASSRELHAYDRVDGANTHLTWSRCARSRFRYCAAQ